MQNHKELQAIVLTPTRELCIQVTQALRSYAEHMDIEVVAVFGGQPIAQQAPRLRAGAQVVVATVGRMKDLIARHIVVLTAVRYVVLDEADEMLDLGFIEDVEKILRTCPNGRQTALFSATMPPPIAKLAERYMYDPVTISITPKQLTVDAIEQAYVEVAATDKTERLREVLQRRGARAGDHLLPHQDRLRPAGQALRDTGLRCKALHGDLSQGQRDGVMIQFKEHKLPLLVATDVAARGLDIEHVTHVINYDLPNNAEIYVHRIGRTGRVGRTGRAITFVTPAQMEDIQAYERQLKTAIGEWEPPEERLKHAPRPRRRDHSKDSKPEREKLEPASEADGADQGGNGSKTETPSTNGAKLFVNRGHGSGIEQDDLHWALTEGAVIPEGDITRIEVLDRFSFVELSEDQAALALERLDGTKLKGKQIRVEYAKS